MFQKKNGREIEKEKEGDIKACMPGIGLLCF